MRMRIGDVGLGILEFGDVGFWIGCEDGRVR